MKAVSTRLKHVRLLIVFMTCLGMVLIPAPRIARAASTWHVSSIGNDANTCTAVTSPCRTISTAIGKAASGDTIQIKGGAYPENIIVSKNLTIAGDPTWPTIIDGGKKNRVVTVQSGVIASFTDLLIQSGSLANSTGDKEGGGIHNAGSLTLTNVTVRNNTLTRQGVEKLRGAGIFNSGSLLLQNSEVVGNAMFGTTVTTTQGGGVYNSGVAEIDWSRIEGNTAVDGAGMFNHGTLFVIGSIVSNNTTTQPDGTNGGGGGIYAHDGINPNLSTTISRSSITGNTATWGGGLNVAGRINITDSTISGNTGTAFAGGMLFFRGNASISNSTISGNTSLGDGGGIYYGSGPNISDPLTISNSTLTNNRANDQGGGMYVGWWNTTSIVGTILAGNTATIGGDCWHEGVPNQVILRSDGYNVVGSNGDCKLTPAPTDQVGTPIEPVDPLLGPLDVNGGPTLTHALLPDSPAIDNGPGVCPPADQRGTPRPFGPACDAGAYESGAPLPPIDLVANALEITQGVQDLNNSVRLVDNKRTFVRFHFSATQSERLAYAELRARRGTQEVVLRPINVGNRVRARFAPDRAVFNHTFVFELPTDYTHGTVELTAEVNPPVDWSRRIVETNYDNNRQLATATFETVLPLKLTLYGVGYGPESAPVYPAQLHFDALVDWMRRAFPVDKLEVKQKSFYFGTVPPSCETVNFHINTISGLATTVGLIKDERHYGMVDDSGGWIRGCAENIPGNVAAGPTGTGTPAWDTDGTYGDWYGAHELGHLYGRKHLRGIVPNAPEDTCGGEKGQDPNYTHGFISETPNGNAAKFGFDVSTQEIYPADWVDVMTYCDQQWISGYTYEALMDFFQGPVANMRTARAQVQGDMLLVVGNINQASQINLQPLFVVPQATFTTPAPGDHAVVLQNAAGVTLARHTFAPTTISETDMRSILVRVPFVSGTKRVVIEGPGGTIMKQIAASTNAPTVTLTSPNGGESVRGSSVTVHWTASDPDNNPLTFVVQYSADDGVSWEAVAPPTTATNARIDARNLPGSPKARFRVVASDGFNSASDTTDGTFTVPNRAPTVAISEPASHTTIVAGQTLGLVANAADGDTGIVPDAQLRWRSSRDGQLGTGRQLSVARLSVGQHTITVEANDGAGGVASASVSVTVAGNPNQVPLPQSALVVNPTTLSFNLAAGQTQQALTIDDEGGTALSWQATSSAPWLKLSASSGMTPAKITATVNPAQVPPGASAAEIVVRSPDVAGDSVTIPVGIATSPYAEPVYVGTGTPQSCTAAALTQAVQQARDGRVYRVAFRCGAAPHTIKLAQTIALGTDMEFDGGGTITLDGNGAVRIFEMCSPARSGLDDFVLTLRGLTLTNGRSDPNRAGGAISNYGCRLNIAHTKFVNNFAVAEAGAISSVFDGEVWINNSTFTGNRATTIGGAIVTHSGALKVYDTLFQNNQALNGNGGAIFGYHPSPVEIKGSTFIGNSSTMHGGAVSIAGTSSISNSTFWKNTSPTGGTAIRMNNALGSITVTNVTAASDQGKVLSGNITLRNSIVANTANAANCEGIITMSGPNLEFPGTSCKASIQNKDPLLKAPAQNGGSTPTAAIDGTSPARDVGDNSICIAAPISNIDQRGQTRPQPLGGRCDLGAFEYVPLSK